jgi:hypothetical protein
MLRTRRRVNGGDIRYIFGHNDRKAAKKVPICENGKEQINKGVARMQRVTYMWQWKNQGPGLSVMNRIVVLSPWTPMETVSRMTGFW